MNKAANFLDGAEPSNTPGTWRPDEPCYKSYKEKIIFTECYLLSTTLLTHLKGILKKHFLVPPRSIHHHHYQIVARHSMLINCHSYLISAWVALHPAYCQKSLYLAICIAEFLIRICVGNLLMISCLNNHPGCAEGCSVVFVSPEGALPPQEKRNLDFLC